MNTLFPIGIFLSFFFQFLLITKKRVSLPDKILAVWMFLFGLHLFSYYLHYLGYWEVYPHLSGLHHPFPLLHGPFLYLYVRFSLQSDQHFSRQNYLHFIPALLCYLYMIPFLFFYSAEEKLLVNQGMTDDYATFITLSVFAFILSAVSYAVASFRLVKQYDELAGQNFANLEQIDLIWLRNFILGMGCTFSFAILFLLLEEGFGMDFGFNTDLVFYLLLITFIIYLGYSGIRHQSIFTDSDETAVQIAQPKSTAEYARSGLKDADALRYHQQLLELMKTRKPYLEPKLTLSSVADDLGVSVNHLSQLINQYEQKNFFDFVNLYRVEEFKQRAADPANMNFNILSVAFDCGFNSKSAFNQVFKKFTGKTPSQFLTEQKQGMAG
ncbi:MAG: helix-turn-helix transcriptional regulator [Candidatus Cyclonatronum sp.]|uniref:helix-turn-helix domain-containing protein n=1 Tax=Cyclonatronum sp. TaxID=3024185 RepID=UPI0025B93851|nr:helix-turn-helix transcriptional regulator [Cyclonatronum sp.]MCH8486896.1 helix-turn-helix transcriptional regulator [Cyclonatronum sp.]